MKKRYLLILAVVLIAAMGAAAWRFLPGGGMALEEGPLRVCLSAEGALSLSWPAAKEEGAEYLLSIKPEDGEWNEPQRLREPQAELTGVSLPFSARVQAVEAGADAGRRWALSADIAPASLDTPELSAEVGENLVSLRWSESGGKVYQVCSLEDGTVVAEVEDLSLELRFGPGEDLELPGADHPLQLAVRAGAKGRDYVLYGPASAPCAVRRGALTGGALSLSCEESESRKYTLSWTETRGDAYEVQEWLDGDWTTLEQLEASQELRYETGRLGSGSWHRYRVNALEDGKTLASQETEFYATVDPLYATVWPILDLKFYSAPGGTGRALKTIPAGTALCVLEEQPGWFQVRYLNDYGYVDSRFCMINLSEYVGDYCAYDITNSYASIFKVHTSAIAQITGQVIPGFEHIQTAEGFLVPYLYPCAQKLLMAAKAVIEDGYRLRIYEAFRPNQATRFLYDTTAAQLNYAALVERGGYYVDPQLNARVDLATGLYTDPATGKQVPRSALMPEPEPEPEPEEEAPEDETGLKGGEDEGGLQAPEETAPPETSAPETPPEAPPVSEETPDPEASPEAPPAPDPEEGEENAGSTEPPPEETEPLPEETEPPLASLPEMEGFLEGTLLLNASASQVPAPAAQSLPVFDTYNKIMTDNGRFGLGSFLARVTSAHNRGIALDLTMETLEEGKRLEMQSAMHDLSWYSATYRNNENAKLLEKYMTATGMRGLTSEWWHFQDDETREAIGLTTYLYKGVDASGWTRDDHGWRWRNAAGVPQKSTTITVDGARWTLDADGYVVE